MKGILNGHRTECLISADDIQKRVKELAEQITKDYENKKLVCVGILNGAYMFYADLTRNLDIDTENCFFGFSSYKNNVRDENVISTVETEYDFRGKHILIIEDIIDTGNTFYKTDIVNKIKHKGAESVKIAVLISKPKSRQREINIDYLGFEIDDYYVYGYGLDSENRGRNIEEIRYLLD